VQRAKNGYRRGGASEIDPPLRHRKFGYPLLPGDNCCMRVSNLYDNSGISPEKKHELEEWNAQKKEKTVLRINLSFPTDVTAFGW